MRQCKLPYQNGHSSYKIGRFEFRYTDKATKQQAFNSLCDMADQAVDNHPEMSTREILRHLGSEVGEVNQTMIGGDDPRYTGMAAQGPKRRDESLEGLLAETEKTISNLSGSPLPDEKAELRRAQKRAEFLREKIGAREEQKQVQEVQAERATEPDQQLAARAFLDMATSEALSGERPGQGWVGKLHTMFERLTSGEATQYEARELYTEYDTARKGEADAPA